ncbi:MAG: methyl-accepting chemotaxis protein [Burkholderiales bacterium RIFCSPLOWO2_12_FULL_61_40]|nr:MAG: methyl-accepting chemotaxis protein [Burkholderiales bacterium RIFCSPLOWO2_12_FULL_61_40]
MSDTAPFALFAWPPQAAVARPVAKTKIYAHAKPTAAVRALFVQQVESITWAYKLAPETINLPAKPGVPEIEVFEIALKQPDVGHAVLKCIDKAIPFPILFVLRYEGHSQPVAAYKRPRDGATGQWVAGDYHAAPWQKDGVAQPGLPVALDLQGLYEQLLRQHLAVPARSGESLRDQLDRLSLLSAKQMAAAKLESRLAQEKQFNRKVEINAQLRTIRTELHALAS